MFMRRFSSGESLDLCKHIILDFLLIINASDKVANQLLIVVTIKLIHTAL